MKVKLEPWEKEIKESYQRGEWKSLGGARRKKIVALARRHLKERRINIRLASAVLNRLQRESEETGIPYQTLISSILYRYAGGKLHDEKYILEAMKVLKRAA